MNRVERLLRRDRDGKTLNVVIVGDAEEGSAPTDVYVRGNN